MLENMESTTAFLSLAGSIFKVFISYKLKALFSYEYVKPNGNLELIFLFYGRGGKQVLLLCKEAEM